MLDIEVTVPPTQDGLDIVTVAEFKRHMRISHTKSDADIEDIIKEAAAKLHGRDGELNRTLFPTTYKRYLTKWPSGTIPLPFPPLVSVTSINIEDGESPPTEVSSSLYTVVDGKLVPEIVLNAGQLWPDVTEGPRAISITYQAGYSEYPAILKRYIKILAGHYYENPEATMMDSRISNVSRAIEFGVADMRAALRIPVDYNDWGE